jgi:hypothetical protein
MTPAQRQKRYRRNLRPSRTKLKQESRRAREAELAAATIKASQALRGSKLYGVIYADPFAGFGARFGGGILKSRSKNSITALVIIAP